MMPAVTLALAGIQHEALLDHLFPSDGLEAAAIMLCARGVGDRKRLVVREIIAVPHERCAVREPDFITWPGDFIEQAIDRGEKDGLTIILVHSHPRGTLAFSARDDESDSSTMPCLFQAYGCVHGSAVMVPGGAMRARLYGGDLTCRTVDLVTVAGHEILHRWAHDAGGRPAAFTSAMTDELGRLTAVVIGVSGTGSITAEEAARMGFGRVILIDFDKVERKNLNRILNATRADIGRPKVEVLADAIRCMGLGTRVVPIQSTLFAADVVRRVALADVLFGCVDSVDGRDLMNRIAAHYVLPYLDVGVRLDADGQGGVDGVHGTVHYLQPDGSSLLSRGAYSAKALQAAHLRRADPELYESQLKEKYVIGVQEGSPAVVSVNTFYAALAVNELLARLHPFRDDVNRRFAQNGVSLSQSRFLSERDGEPDLALVKHAGRGDRVPLLDMPEFSPVVTKRAS